jgi:hypothetical protein
VCYNASCFHAGPKPIVELSKLRNHTPIYLSFTSTEKVNFEGSTQIINCIYLGIPQCHAKTIEILQDESDGVRWFLAGGIAVLFCFPQIVYGGCHLSTSCTLCLCKLHGSEGKGIVGPGSGRTSRYPIGLSYNLAGCGTSARKEFVCPTVKWT